MRILVDMATHVAGSPEIVQVEKTPALGSDGQTIINGKYAIPVPVGSLSVNTSSYVLNAGDIDGSDVVSLSYAKLLAQMPQFSIAYINPLLTAAHIAELDYTGSFKYSVPGDPPTYFYPRMKTGYPTGAAFPTGQAPGYTAILPQNDTVSPARPGLILSDTIDISPYLLDCSGDPEGANVFAVYWYLYDYSFTDDVAADYGALSGINEPARRYIEETSQEPADFSVYLSTDNGSNWTQVRLLKPVVFTAKSKTIKVAFLNRSRSTRYLASFGVLF